MPSIWVDPRNMLIRPMASLGPGKSLYRYLPLILEFNDVAGLRGDSVELLLFLFQEYKNRSWGKGEKRIWVIFRGCNSGVQQLG